MYINAPLPNWPDNKGLIPIHLLSYRFGLAVLEYLNHKLSVLTHIPILNCFLLLPEKFLTGKIMHCHQLREYIFWNIFFFPIFYNYSVSQIIHIFYIRNILHCWSKCILSSYDDVTIYNWDSVFQKYHYMSYSYIS